MYVYVCMYVCVCVIQYLSGSQQWLLIINNLFTLHSETFVFFVCRSIEEHILKKKVGPNTIPAFSRLKRGVSDTFCAKSWS